MKPMTGDPHKPATGTLPPLARFPARPGPDTEAELETVTACDLCLATEIDPVDPECRLWACRRCGYVFDNPRPTLAELVRFYSKPTQYDGWIAEERARDALWRRRLRKIGEPASGATLLDVGTGTGQFLHLAAKVFARVAGTEVSESAVALAGNRYGLDVRRGCIEDLDFETPFDVVTLFHVLEHVPSPRRTVEKCRSLLRPGGLLVVAVPNELQSAKLRAKQVLGRVGARRYRRLGRFGLQRIRLDTSTAEVHLSHFTPSVLRGFLEDAGFSLVSHSLDPYYVSTGFRAILSHLYYHANLAWLRLAGWNAYDTIWMVARKQETGPDG